MMLERETAADLFGLAGSFPRPGWVVLDAARDHRFTGELVFESSPEVRVYLDRGEIYLAERASDVALGSRLVDGGALTTTQLEQGAMRVGDTEHLGRLFDRVPSVDREYVLLMTQLMNEECVAWVARQHVRSAASTPYRHHPSGIHRWERPTDAVDLQPGDPLPAPGPGDAPAEIAAPEPVFLDFSNDADPLIRWDEPSWLDERFADSAVPAPPVASPPDPPVAMAPPTPVPNPVVESPAAALAPPTLQPPAAAPTPEPKAAPAPEPTTAPEPQPTPIVEPVTRAAPPAIDTSEPGPLESLLRSDWADRLETHGLPEPGSDPLAVPTPLPPLPAENQERFELIWPSGEIDDEFGGSAEIDREDDRDRVGLTARVVRSVAIPEEPTTEPAEDDAGWWDFETTGPSFGPSGDAGTAPGLGAAGTSAESGVTDDPGLTDVSDDVVLSVRRAVASIETGSLAARRRLADTPIDEDSSRGIDPPLPGRVATRSEYSVWSAQSSDVSATRSVFDEVVAPSAASEVPSTDAEPTDISDGEDEAPRVSALRRLIGGLRRR